MKSLIPSYYVSALIVLLFSCNNGPADPIKSAKKENAERIDSLINREQPVSSMAKLLSKKDADFLVNAANGGMLEVELGQLAQTNARNQRVKDFGAMMIKDHSESAQKLEALATSKSITLPDAIGNRQQKEKERLQKKKGDAFDKAYIDLMVSDHKKDIREFEQEATNGTNETVKAFASSHLKMLHTHLDSAVSIQRMTGKKISTGSNGPPPGLY
jgi:putative membrane protein